VAAKLTAPLKGVVRHRESLPNRLRHPRGERLAISGTGSFETTPLLPENLGTDPIRITAPEVAGTETLVLSIRGS